MKTISGHYGSVFSLDHNNRNFIPNNCNLERLDRNYYPVIAGGDIPFALPDLRFEDEMWAEYHRLLEVYWKDRVKVKAEEYEHLITTYIKCNEKRPLRISQRPFMLCS